LLTTSHRSLLSLFLLMFVKNKATVIGWCKYLRTDS
jgi:hypothetical protein